MIIFGKGRVLVGDITACLQFYTRLPVPSRSVEPGRFGSAQWAAPLAGVVIGLCGAGLHWIAHAAGMPPAAAAALTLGGILLLTGCLHEDGLADVADGFGGGHTPEQKLTIMKDSRIGTYGVAALGISLLLRWSALMSLPTGLPALLTLVAAHAASRGLIAAAMRTIPPARASGLSAAAGRPSAWAACIAMLLGVAALAMLWPAKAVAAAALLSLWFLFLRRLCLRQIGGQTGDVLGLLQQGGEIIVLLTACGTLA